VNEEPDWQDYIFLAIEREEIDQLAEFCNKIDIISEKMDDFRKKNEPNGKSLNFDWPNTNFEPKNGKNELQHSHVLLDSK
jgi:hypothetical protein